MDLLLGLGILKESLRKEETEEQEQQPQQRRESIDGWKEDTAEVAGGEILKAEHSPGSSRVSSDFQVFLRP